MDRRELIVHYLPNNTSTTLSAAFNAKKYYWFIDTTGNLLIKNHQHKVVQIFSSRFWVDVYIEEEVELR